MKNNIFGINFVSANENDEQHNLNKKELVPVIIGVCLAVGAIFVGIIVSNSNNMSQTITIVNNGGNSNDSLDEQEELKFVEVPNVKGCPKEDAIQILQENHLKFRLDVDFNGYEGTQYIVKDQSYDPDSTVEENTVVELTLIPV